MVNYHTAFRPLKVRLVALDLPSFPPALPRPLLAGSPWIRRYGRTVNLSPFLTIYYLSVGILVLPISASLSHWCIWPGVHFDATLLSLVLLRMPSILLETPT